jgi:hypothetical protein
VGGRRKHETRDRKKQAIACVPFGTTIAPPCGGTATRLVPALAAAGIVLAAGEPPKDDKNVDERRKGRAASFERLVI